MYITGIKPSGFFIIGAFFYGMLTGCTDTQGSLRIRGKVVDAGTQTGIPYKNIVIQGLKEINNKNVPIELCQFSTDSSGKFDYSLKKLKDAYYYRFCLVGDSDYLVTNHNIPLNELEKNAEFLSLPLNRLTDLTIRLSRKSRTAADTLCLSWESDRIYFWFLYPYDVINFGGTSTSFDPPSGMGLTWIGRNVNSTVTTRVFADKRTEINWELYRNGKKMRFSDTITCKRDIINIVYFSY